MKNIDAFAADLVAAGNIGCLTQLQARIDVPIVAHRRAVGLGLRRPSAARPGGVGELRLGRAEAQSQPEEYIDA